MLIISASTVDSIEISQPVPCTPYFFLIYICTFECRHTFEFVTGSTPACFAWIPNYEIKKSCKIKFFQLYSSLWNIRSFIRECSIKYHIITQLHTHTQWNNCEFLFSQHFIHNDTQLSSFFSSPVLHNTQYTKSVITMQRYSLSVHKHYYINISTNGVFMLFDIYLTSLYISVVPNSSS